MAYLNRRKVGHMEKNDFRVNFEKYVYFLDSAYTIKRKRKKLFYGTRDCIQRKTWYMGVDYKSPYLIVNCVVSYPPPLQRERDGARLSTFVFVCEFPKQQIGKG